MITKAWQGGEGGSNDAGWICGGAAFRVGADGTSRLRVAFHLVSTRNGCSESTSTGRGEGELP